jgi:hypothetical protein
LLASGLFQLCLRQPCIRTRRGFMLRYLECGVPMYGNSVRMSVWGFRPVGGH